VRYQIKLGQAPAIPLWLWIFSFISVLIMLGLCTHILQRSQQIQALQAQLLGQAMLPLPSQRSQVVDPQLNKAYDEMLQASAQLTLPVQAWMNCLHSPGQAPVRIESFDWNSAVSTIELRLNLSSREAFNHYLQAMSAEGKGCSVTLRQEERLPDGNQRFNLQLRPQAEGQSHER
jgi:hypothetical protein